jgi:hypothetical protein
MLTKITPKTLTAISADIKLALEAIAVKHGVALAMGRGRYTHTQGTLKVEVSLLGSDGKGVDKYAEAFTQLADLYGFKASELGTQFKFGNNTFQIIGLNTKAKAYPILAKNVATGKGFKFSTGMIRTGSR